MTLNQYIQRLLLQTRIFWSAFKPWEHPRLNDRRGYFSRN